MTDTDTTPPNPPPHQRTYAHTNTHTFRVTELQQINQLRERAEAEVAKGFRVATPNMGERDQVHNQCTQTRTGGFGLPHEPSLSVRRGCFETLSITHTLNALICRSRVTDTNTLTHTHYTRVCRAGLQQGVGSVTTVCSYCHAPADGRKLPQCDGCRKQPRPRLISHGTACE